jgi:hypothetical protein
MMCFSSQWRVVVFVGFLCRNVSRFWQSLPFAFASRGAILAPSETRHTCVSSLPSISVLLCRSLRVQAEIAKPKLTLVRLETRAHATQTTTFCGGSLKRRLQVRRPPVHRVWQSRALVCALECMEYLPPQAPTVTGRGCAVFHSIRPVKIGALACQTLTCFSEDAIWRTFSSSSSSFSFFFFSFNYFFK